MSLIHSLCALASGGVTGIQSAQRDWSPFLVHFTSYSEMTPIRNAVAHQHSPQLVLENLQSADRASFDVVRQIAESQELLAHSPAAKDSVPSCVSFSECTLPGLIGLSERYGRFGFVFLKKDVFALGGRPCIYVDRDCYGQIAANGRNTDPNLPSGKLFALANVYSPPGNGQIQDFTHEREWRVFSNISFNIAQPILLICPSDYIDRISRLFCTGIPCVSIDTMYLWGA